MFDFIRTHSKAALFVLFLLVVPSFVLLGTGNETLTPKSPVVATVDGQDIRQDEWDAAHEQEGRRLKVANPRLDAKLLDSPEAKYATLEKMVRERVLTAAVAKFKLGVSDRRLASELQQDPTIASLRRADGTLDMERYKQLAGSQGMTPEMFEAQVRSQLSVQQVLQGVAESGFAPRRVADQAIGAFFEKREVRMARFSPADYLTKVSPSEADLEAYYKDNAARFVTTEQARIEYVVLDLATVQRNVVPSEQDLKTYYEQNLAKLAGKDERRASHILLAVAKDAPAAERQKAKARAEALLAEVKKAPQKFAEIARAQSQDPGSAAAGGDLDFFTRGAMVKPFEDAAFAMAKGEISGLVESDFGYHIIQLTDIKAAKQKSFEEMRPTLEAEFRKQAATSKYAEAAEAFTNAVYEQSDSLKGVADKLKLEVKTADAVSRQPAPGATGPLANANFLNAVLSADAVEKKRNTEAIEFGPSQLVSGRIVQHQPARTIPLAEVKTLVRELVAEKQANALAKKEGAEKLAAWRAKPDTAALAETQSVSREQAKLPPSLIRGVMRADVSQLPAWTGVDLGESGYAVVRIDKVVPRDAVDEARGGQERGQFSRWWTSAEGQAYFNLLKDKFKVKIKVAAPATGNA